MENLELKARCIDLAAAHANAVELGAVWQWQVEQQDTYFAVPNGKMKIRQVPGLPAELITYHRPSQSDARFSDYEIYRTLDPDKLISTLGKLFPVELVIRKQRTLFLWKNVRIHLDEVEGLGRFLEFEVVLASPEGRDQAQSYIQELIKVFNIAGQDLCADGYYNLMLNGSSKNDKNEKLHQ